MSTSGATNEGPAAVALIDPSLAWSLTRCSQFCLLEAYPLANALTSVLGVGVRTVAR